MCTPATGYGRRSSSHPGTAGRRCHAGPVGSRLNWSMRGSRWPWAGGVSPGEWWSPPSRLAGTCLGRLAGLIRRNHPPNWRRPSESGSRHKQPQRPKQLKRVPPRRPDILGVRKRRERISKPSARQNPPTSCPTTSQNTNPCPKSRSTPGQINCYGHERSPRSKKRRP